MTDKELVERLRLHANCMMDEWESTLCKRSEFITAANRIEQLRAELTNERIDNTNLIVELATVAAERDRYKAERENPQPLTLEDLRGMDGEWVWAISSDPDLTVSAWAYIVASQAHTLWEYKPDRLLGNVQLDFENYGKTWLAYVKLPDNTAGSTPAAKSLVKKWKGDFRITLSALELDDMVKCMLKIYKATAPEDLTTGLPTGGGG